MPMESLLLEAYALLSFGFGCLVTYLWMSAQARWRRGRGLLGKPASVAAENAKRMKEAHSDRSQGWRELLRSLVDGLLAVALLFLLGVVLAGVV